MSNKSPIDTIQLPQGGGAISGMGEKFSPDLFTGTGNFSVPIAVPPGRNGMQPSLSLGYSTGSGNSPFGLGWGLSVPGVMRQTSKGLPRYVDHPTAGLGFEGATLMPDTFVLSGAEDLVPVPGGSELAFGEPGFVQWYRPRTEGLFARIERYLDVDHDYWKVWTKEGLVSYYGTPDSAGADPCTIHDPNDPHKVFGWKLSKTEDIFGNHILYEYERDLVHVDGPHAWEQSYLKSVKWNDFLVPGNLEPQYLCRVEFVYGVRPDPFSEYHAGFEVRTVRRCEEIRIYHDPQLSAGYTTELHVKTYKLTYLDERVTAGEVSAELLPLNGVSLLSRVQVIGHDDVDEYLPPLDFGYSRYEPLARDFRAVGGENLPAFSLSQPDMELVDLFGRGLPDVVQLNGSARYWRNLGDGNFALPRQFRDIPAGVHLGDPNVSLIDANGNGTADLMVQKAGISGYYPMRFNGEWEERAFVRHKTVPTFSLNDPEVKLLDLDGDGVTDVLRNGSRFELFFNDRELGFHELKVVNRGVIEDFPEVSFSDTRVRIANLCGGLPAICMIYQGRIDYWPHMGRGVWGKRITMKHSPRFPDRFNPAHVLVGDLDGDGYDDIVYLEHDQITVWINQSGNGFAEPFVVKGTPPISDRDAVRIVDIMGTGTAGLLWSVSGSVSARSGQMLFLDLCGGQKPYLMHEMVNNLGARTKVEYLPSTHYYHLDYVKPSTRWITPLPFPVLCVARVEVFDEISLGKLTTEYTYHHGYWDGEEREFRGFGRVDQRDTESFQRYNSPGLLNTGAGSQVEAVHFSPPTETRTWFHLGAIVKTTSTGNVSLYDDWTEADFSAEYWSGDANRLSRPAPMVSFLKALPAKRRREALRTLRGSILRSELYALDGSSLQDRPYTVSENQTGVAQVVYLDDAGDFSYELSFNGIVAGIGDRLDLGKYWLFFPHGISSRSSNWERGVEPMTSLSFQGGYDQYGNAGKAVSIAVPKARMLDWTQSVMSSSEFFLGTCAVTNFIHSNDSTHYLAGKPAEVKTYEVLNNGMDSVFVIVDGLLDGSWTNLQLFGWVRNYYDGDPGEEFLGANGGVLGSLGDYGVVVRTETLVLDDDVLDDAYGSINLPIYIVDSSPNYSGTDYPSGFQSIAPNAGYVKVPVTIGMTTFNYYFSQSRMKYDFHDSLVHFQRGLLLATRDPFGNETTVAYDDYFLFPSTVTNAAGNVVAAEYDYRVLQPSFVTDPNGNRAQMAFSPLGFPFKSLKMGKISESKGDTLAYPGILFEYDFLAFFNWGEPVWVRSVVREHHHYETGIPLGHENNILVKVEYTDGLGRLLQVRTQTESVVFGSNQFGDSGLPALQSDPNANAIGEENTTMTSNVVVSGWQSYNNKGAVVEKWEPFFDAGWDFNVPNSAIGAKFTQFYDPMGEVIRTVNPDHSERLVVLGRPDNIDLSPSSFTPTPWEKYTYDTNDLAEITHTGLTHHVPNSHWLTPRSVKVDALGRTVESTDRNYNGGQEEVVMKFAFDIRGNTLQVDDAIRNAGGTRASAFLHIYDYANKPIRTTHIDKGTSKVVINAAGLPVETNDAKGACMLSAYDELSRPTDIWARDVVGESLSLRQHIIYGEPQGDTLNHRGKPFKHYDEAGMVEFLGYDFKGNLLGKKRRVIKDAEILAVFNGPPTNWVVQAYRVEWTGLNESTLLETTEYETSYYYDALNRVTRVALPADLGSGRKVVEASFNRAGVIQSIVFDGDTYVEHISYNARGQRLLVAFGNGIMTRYTYDPETFRLLRQRSEEYAYSLIGTTHTYAYQTGSLRQDNAYIYDLAGNIVRITDGRSDSDAGGSGNLIRDLEYDPLYRLLHDNGRESTNYTQYADPSQVGNVSNGVANTRIYHRYYQYDRLGNMLEMSHVASGNTFNRTFNTYDISGNPNPYEAGNLATEIEYGGTTVNYSFDSNGNMVSEGSSRHFEWDFGDRMRAFYNQTGTTEPTVYTHYLYGADGRRVKKITRKGGSLKEVSVYIDGSFEYLYELDGSNTVSEELNEIHVMDSRSRIARIQIYGSTWSGITSDAILYNLEDHLGNSSFTLSDTGGEISQEEYFPFGETSFGCYAKKLYRFCGKERDEESGLYYYGARYYAPWSCRFVSIDPLAGKYPFYTPYQYAGNQPIIAIDIDGLENEKPNNNQENNTSNGNSENQQNPDAEMQKNIEESANTFSRSGFGFLGRSEALYYWWQDVSQKQVDKESVHWKRDEKMGSENNPGMELIKGTPSEAIRSIGNHPEKWVFDCAMHCQIILLHAALKTYGDDKFNQQFSTAKGGYSLHFGFFESSGLTTTKNIVKQGDSYIDITNEQNPIPVGNADDWSKLINEAPVGSIITMHTTDPTMDSAWRNENILKVSQDEFSAHDFGVLPMNEILARLNSQANDQNQYYLFQIQHVKFLEK